MQPSLVNLVHAGQPVARKGETMYGNGSSILRVGTLKLFRWNKGKPTLDLTVPDPFSHPAPVLKYGWQPFFVARFPDKTVWTYRR
jgi:hypothetical protein